MIIDPSVDRGVELSLHETGTYEKGILDFIKKNFQKEGCFVDVGANIGLMSIFVAKNFPTSRVVSFEAHPVTKSILDDNIELNQIHNILVHPIALSNVAGNVMIYDNWEVNRGGASIKFNTGTSSGIAVKCAALDEFPELNPTIIKIDVEGAEWDVLQGAKEVIQRCKPILIIEISKSRDASDETESIFQFIQGFGFYSMYKLKGGKERVSTLTPIHFLNDLPEHDNIICVANG